MRATCSRPTTGEIRFEMVKLAYVQTAGPGAQAWVGWLHR